MKSVLQGVLLASTVLACLNLPQALAAAGTQATKGSAHLRGARYCEILLVTGTISAPVASVYSTIGLNRCPEAQWKALVPSKIQQKEHALGIEMNGPRYFMVDSIALSSHTGPVISFNGLQMRQLASIKVSMGGLSSAPYTERTILRTTTYTYVHGKPCYELLSPNGHTYVLQSYAQILDPTLTAAALPTLAQRITLPKGWHYKMVVPTKDLVLQASGSAIVIQDTLDNSYQRAH